MEARDQVKIDSMQRYPLPLSLVEAQYYWYLSRIVFFTFHQAGDDTKTSAQRDERRSDVEKKRRSGFGRDGRLVVAAQLAKT